MATDNSPLNVDPATMTERDRARLAARRAALDLFPTYGTEAAVVQGKRFVPRSTPDAWALSNAVTQVWRQATYFSPIGDTTRFFPVVARFDEQGRLHNATGPAIEFSDGFLVFFIHGIEVGRQAIESPASIPINLIRDCKNIEQRRILIDLYGKDRYILGLGLKPIHRDDFGELYRADIPNDEPLCMVKVLNSTPEPCAKCGTVTKEIDARVGGRCDCGTPFVYKDYWMCVPFTVQTAREAVAWTFSKSAEGYRPLRET